MQGNSFTLDVHDVTIKEFFDKSYEGLVRGIASAVNCGDYQVRLFNIESRIIKAKSPLEDDISNLKLWVAVYKNDRFSFYNPFFGRDMETGFQNSKSHSPSFQRWLVCRRNKQLPLTDIQKELLVTH